jgi:hypothetical protein
MAKDSDIRADSEVVRDTNMMTRSDSNITDFDDAATVRWLRARLEPARVRTAATPAAEAVDRIRARVFGEATPRRGHRSIAA